jgi:hypothetical protein
MNMSAFFFEDPCLGLCHFLWWRQIKPEHAAMVDTVRNQLLLWPRASQNVLLGMSPVDRYPNFWDARLACRSTVSLAVMQLFVHYNWFPFSVSLNSRPQAGHVSGDLWNVWMWLPCTNQYHAILLWWCCHAWLSYIMRKPDHYRGSYMFSWLLVCICMPSRYCENGPVGQF